MRHYTIDSSRGPVAAHILAPEVFGGEHERRGIFYVGGAWALSLLAMTTNVGQATFRKLLTGKKGRLSRVLWEMGRDMQHVSSAFYDRFSRYNHQTKVGAAGWRSLDLFYNYHDKVKPILRKDVEGLVTRHWLGKSPNRQAVTNRLKIAINLLSESFKRLSNEPEIRLLSIASGSAQAVVEAMKRHPELNVKVLLIDFDESALVEARKLVHESGLDERFAYKHDSTKAIEKASHEFRPHMIEMIGFLDYRPRQKAISLINRIREQLPPGGVFMTCNIHPNWEKICLDWVLLWPMIYRTDKEFADVVVEGGFAPENVRLIYEPFKIHGIAVCNR